MINDLVFLWRGKILVGEGEVSGGIEGRRTLEWRSDPFPLFRSPKR